MNQHSKNEARAGTQLRDKVRSLVRDELLQAAEAVFSEEGLQTAKVESIAARAGVSVGSVYNYFADRQSLVNAVMESRREELLSRLDALQIKTAGHPFRDRVDAAIAAVLEYFHAQRPYFLLMLQSEGGGAMAKQALLTQRDPCQGPFGSIFTHLEALMGQGVSEGELRDEPPRALATFLFGVTKGMGLASLADPAAGDVRLSKDMILRYFFHGAGPFEDAPTSRGSQ